MKSFLRNWRRENMGNVWKYIIYAIGEILLIIIGILIAVNINERQSNKKNNQVRCIYLEELNFSILHDINDVKENIGLFEERNHKLKELIGAIESKNLSKLDSVMDKINTLNTYVYFVQQSKSKIEELKYSNVNLITNRSLKNKILYYQESRVLPLLWQEARFFKFHDKVQEYFEGVYYNIDLKKLENDRRFFAVASQKYNASEGMRRNYEDLLSEIEELQELIEVEMNNQCRKR